MVSASVEFFVLFTLLLFIFAFFIGLIGTIADLFSSIKARERAGAVAFEVAQKINSVLISGDGSRTNAFVPVDLNISYQARAIEAKDWLNRSGFAAVLTDDVFLFANSGNLSISNVNGTVIIDG